jgi:hypothetical protein
LSTSYTTSWDLTFLRLALANSDRAVPQNSSLA